MTGRFTDWSSEVVFPDILFYESKAAISECVLLRICLVNTGYLFVAYQLHLVFYYSFTSLYTQKTTR